MHALKYLLLVIVLSLSAPVAFADLKPGQALQSVDIELLNGDTLTAKQLAGKPAAYLFWATWCHICRSELPAYQKLHARYQARGFRVIALSLDESATEVKQFWADAGYTIPVAMRTDALRDAFGDIRGTPTLYVIDRKGRLVKKQLGGISPDELEAIIKRLL
jgi:thiol-disulfide isomerase/thioredoxin